MVSASHGPKPESAKCFAGIDAITHLPVGAGIVKFPEEIDRTVAAIRDIAKGR